MKTAISFILILLCNTALADVTPKQIIESLKSEGIKVTNLKEEKRDPSSPLPNSFQERWVFKDANLNNGKGGQFFICSKKSYCDAIYSYFEALSFIAGPYLYRNPEGTVVFQLNKSHSPDGAEKYEKALSKLHSFSTDGTSNSQSTEQVQAEPELFGTDEPPYKDIVIEHVSLIKGSSGNYGYPLAKVINPNDNAGAECAGYTISLISEDGSIIGVDENCTSLLPLAVSYIGGQISLNDKNVKEIEVKFGPIKWKEVIKYGVPVLSVTNMSVTKSFSGYKATGMAKNESQLNLDTNRITIIFYDKNGEVIDYQNAFVDLAANDQKPFETLGLSGIQKKPDHVEGFISPSLVSQEGVFQK